LGAALAFLGDAESCAGATALTPELARNLKRVESA
jgi:hypothetical protein